MDGQAAECVSPARQRKLTGKEQPGAWLLKAFARGGVDTRQLFQRLPGPMDLALRTPEMVTPDMVNAILLECASLSGDSNFGLRMVELTDTADLGIYGYLLMNAPAAGPETLGTHPRAARRQLERGRRQHPGLRAQLRRYLLCRR